LKEGERPEHGLGDVGSVGRLRFERDGSPLQELAGCFASFSYADLYRLLVVELLI